MTRPISRGAGDPGIPVHHVRVHHQPAERAVGKHVTIECAVERDAVYPPAHGLGVGPEEQQVEPGEFELLVPSRHRGEPAGGAPLPPAHVESFHRRGEPPGGVTPQRRMSGAGKVGKARDEPPEVAERHLRGDDGEREERAAMSETDAPLHRHVRGREHRLAQIERHRRTLELGGAHGASEIHGRVAHADRERIELGAERRVIR